MFWSTSSRTVRCHAEIAPECVLKLSGETGGDVNVADEDGDTPIYTVENVDTAQWLVEHGANVHRVNAEGVSVSPTRRSPQQCVGV